MNTVMLFGSKGFIGQNIKKHFEQEGRYELICPVKKDCDLLKSSSVKKIVSKFQPHYIINAAYYGGVTSHISFNRKNYLNNINICINIVNAANYSKNHKGLIHFGSSLEYDSSIKSVNESSFLNPKSYYALVKTTTSLLFQHLAKEKNIPYILIRPFNLYGLGNKNNVIYYVIRSILDNKTLYLTKGKQYRDYLYIEDFTLMLHDFLRNWNKVELNSVYNFGSGKATKLLKIFNSIFKQMDYEGRVNIKDYSENEYWYQVANVSKLKKVITKVRNIDLDYGINKTICWIKNEKKDH